MATAAPSGSGSTGKHTVQLQCADGNIEVVELADLTAYSPFFGDLVEDCGAGEVVPLKSVRSRELSRVVAFCVRRRAWRDSLTTDRAAQMSAEKRFRSWEQEELLGPLDQAQLYDLLMAANYLHVEPLIDACLGRVAGLLQGKTEEEVRQLLGIEGDLGPEQMEQILQDNRAMFS